MYRSVVCDGTMPMTWFWYLCTKGMNIWWFIQVMWICFDCCKQCQDRLFFKWKWVLIYTNFLSYELCSVQHVQNYVLVVHCPQSPHISHPWHIGTFTNYVSEVAVNPKVMETFVQDKFSCQVMSDYHKPFSQSLKTYDVVGGTSLDEPN